MSDQQLVTGLSIVISAYVRLQRDLSFYHWRMITTLAWFSSATHLATLLFLRQHMQSNRYIWYARALLMFGLALMVALAIIPTGVPVSMDPSEDDQVDQKVTLGMPARCALSCINPEIFDFEDGTMMLLSEIILLGALCARLLGIFSSIEGFSIRPILGRLWRRPLLWSCDRLQSSSKRAQALLLPPLVLHLSAGISMKATLDIIGSDVGGVGGALYPCDIWLLTLIRSCS